MSTNQIKPEIQEWFNQVKGKKIRFKTAPCGHYMIPSTLVDNAIFLSTRYINGKLVTTDVLCGKPGSQHWEMLEESSFAAEVPMITDIIPRQKQLDTQKPIEHLCQCALRDLMAYGCKCGGK